MRFKRSERAALAGGFTLIEMMVVVAIVAILASIALPSYQDSVRKAARRAAQGLMLDIANRQQQFFLDNRSYASSLSALNVPKPPEIVGRYNLDAADLIVSAGTPPCFTVTLRAINNQTADGNLTLDCRGSKTWKGSAGW